LEEQQELCWEFDGFELVGMTGGTPEHSAIHRIDHRALPRWSGFGFWSSIRPADHSLKATIGQTPTQRTTCG
jgi:hypothetical protein